MGFYLSGKNPQINISRDKFKTYDKYNKIDDWAERASQMDEAGERSKYWEEYEEFQTVNPGIYFRNNCWYWRPLWDYVVELVGDILTDEDIEGGCYNNYHFITKVKSKKIAVRLERELKKGNTGFYDMAYKDMLDQREEGDFKANYPFSEDNVRHFARFCRESGGFYIG